MAGDDRIIKNKSKNPHVTTNTKKLTFLLISVLKAYFIILINTLRISKNKENSPECADDSKIHINEYVLTFKCKLQ